MKKENEKLFNNRIKTKAKQQSAMQFKTKYFDFYDDVKDPSHKIVDW